MRQDRLASLLLAATLVLSGCKETNEGAAQNGLAESKTAANDIPAGTTLEVSLDQALALADIHPGDSFTAKVKQTVTRDGNDLIPTGTPVRGSVASVQELPGSQGAMVVALDFRELEMNGLAHSMRTTVVAVQTQAQNGNGEAEAAVQSGSETAEDTSPAPTQSKARDTEALQSHPETVQSSDASATENAAHPEASPKALSLGDVVPFSQASQGGAYGNLERVGIVMKTSQGVAVLPAGSVVRLRLEESLELARSSEY